MNIRKLAAVAGALLFPAIAGAAEYLVYAGTYTNGASRGIYGYRFDSQGGKLKSLGLMATLSNPTYLVEHPDHRYLYAVSEDAANRVSAFLVDPKSGKLTPVNQASSKGDRPCYLALDRSGRWLAVANSGDGGVAILPLRKDGGVGEGQAAVRPAGADDKLKSHATGVFFSPDNRFLLIADFGLDRIYSYRFDAESGALTPAPIPFTAAAPGAGVRSLAFHPNGRIVYAVNEIRPGVTTYRYDPASGGLTEIQTFGTTEASKAAKGAAAGIAVNAAGNRVYATNRVVDDMALLVVDPVRFALEPLEFTPLVGRSPRFFAFDPTGAFLLVANQDSNDITVYSVHPHTGQLRPVGRAGGRIELPACLAFVAVP